MTTVVPLRASRRPTARRRAPEIIEAAARVFAERGFHGATTQDIADVLGIRQASLYYYFPSKEGALELVCLQGVAGYFEVAKAIAAGPGRATDKLARLIKAHLAPLTDRSSTSTTSAGNVITRAGAGAASAGGAFFKDGVELSRATPGARGSGRLSSLELQLETPKAATSDNTIIVQARRAGVHNASPVSLFLVSCIDF